MFLTGIKLQEFIFNLLEEMQFITGRFIHSQFLLISFELTNFEIIKYNVIIKQIFFTTY